MPHFAWCPSCLCAAVQAVLPEMSDTLTEHATAADILKDLKKVTAALVRTLSDLVLHCFLSRRAFITGSFVKGGWCHELGCLFLPAR